MLEALPRLEIGPGLCLRQLERADIGALFAIFGDPVVTRFWGFATLPDLQAAAALLDDIHAQARAGTLYQWGLQAGTELVGTCTLAALDADNRRAEIGFALARAHQGRGLMASALPALLTHAFEDLDLHRLYADTDPRNLASIRRLEQLGFQREGLMREHYLVAGEAQDALMFGLLRADWRQR